MRYIWCTIFLRQQQQDIGLESRISRIIGMQTISNEEIATTTYFSRKYPKERVTSNLPSALDWLVSKQNIDQLHSLLPADIIDTKKHPNLWRIHDDLYDFTHFQHPGGKEFLEMTENTDVTELFESSHPNIDKARAFLNKYKIDLPKETKLPLRNTDRLLFDADGFYCTLRGRVSEILKTIEPLPYQQTTAFVLDSLLIGYLSFQALSIHPALSSGLSYTFAVIAGFLLACLANCSHNFWHLRNNWRMYTFDLTCYSSYEWRVTHGYSHHTYPNSVLDYEIWAFEPLLHFMPLDAKKNVPSIVPLIVIFIVFPIGMFLALVKRARLIITGHQKFRWEHTLPFITTALLIIFRSYLVSSSPDDETVSLLQSNQAVFVFKRLLVIHSSCSFLFYILGLGGVHHHPNIWHAGDNSKEAPGNGSPGDRGIDWGIYQLIAVGDRPSVDESLFLSSISFGRHCLHHMFPTIDLCQLPRLVPVFEETCREFHVEFFIPGSAHDENHKKWPKHRSFGWIEGWVGAFQQAVRADKDITNFPPLDNIKSRSVKN